MCIGDSANGRGTSGGPLTPNLGEEGGTGLFWDAEEGVLLFEAPVCVGDSVDRRAAFDGVLEPDVGEDAVAGGLRGGFLAFLCVGNAEVGVVGDR